MHRKIIFIVAVLTFVFGASFALADPAAFGVFTTRYPGTAYDCTVCHGPGGPPTNPYGAALAPLPVTDAELAAIEGVDSDGDTFTNLVEIQAGSLPGDPASVPPPPGVVIEITSPNGGEVIPSGSSTPITYTAPAEVTKVKVKYSLDNGQTWFPAIDAGGSVIGTYNWLVPTPKKNKTKALVKVIGFDVSNTRIGVDKSNAVFTIETVSITVPAAGDTVSAPSQVITWVTNGTKAPVDSFVLFYSTNNGTQWKKIFKSPAGSGNPGTYTWDSTSPKPIPTPATPKTKSLIKLVLKDNTGATVATAISGKFTIQ